MHDSCRVGRPRLGAVSHLAQWCDRALELTTGEAMSVADLAESLAVSDRMARRIVATLRADPNAKQLFIERWGMIERDKSGPYYVPIYRRKTDRRQRDARKPNPSARAARDAAVKKLRLARAETIEGAFAALMSRRG